MFFLTKHCAGRWWVVCGVLVLGVGAQGQTTFNTAGSIIASNASEDNGVIIDGVDLTVQEAADASSLDGIIRSGVVYRNAATLTNNGLITGNIENEITGGPHTLNFTNTGNLFGNILLTTDSTLGGDDIVRLKAGSVYQRGPGQGQSFINTGFGDDLLILDGDDADVSGFFTFDTVFDLEQARIEGTSPWTLDRSVTLENGLTIDDGATVRYFSGGVTGDVTIDPNATFTGVFVTIGGDVTADGKIGAERTNFPLTITGDLTVNNSAGAGVTTNVAADGSASRIEVGGNLTVNGGELSVVELTGLFPDSSTFEVVNTAGTTTGTFATVTNTYPFLTATADYSTPGKVLVTLARNNAGFAAITTNKNQDNTARIIEVFDAAAGAGTEARTIADAYTSLGTDTEKLAALDRLSGESLGSAPRIATQSSRGFGRGLDRRARMMHVFLAEGDVLPTPQLATSGGMTHDLTMLSAAALAHPGQTRELDSFTPGVWIDVLGGTGDIEGDNAASIDYDYTGVLGGFDIAISNDWIVGFSGGYTTGSYDANSLGSTGDLDTIHVGAYTAFIRDQWRFNGSMGFAFDEYDTSRAVVFGGIDRVASGDFSGETFSVDGTATYRFDLDNGIKLETFGSLEYFRSQVEDYAESGAGGANLTVAESDFDAMYATLGARVFKSFHVNEMSLTPEVRAGWQHELLDADAAISASFSSAGFGVPIRIVGVDPDDDAALLGAGLTADFNRKFSLRFDYDTRISGNQTDDQFRLALRVPW